MVREVTKHPGEALVEVVHVEAVGFPRFTTAFQKVGIGDSTPRKCNRFRLESVGLGGVVTVLNPMAVHLKDLERGEVQVFNQVVDL